MIPRLRPYFDHKELLAALRPMPNAVEIFEQEFARLFETKYALTFSYGRSGLYALFKALGLQNAEIIVPAYTCVVVPHAVVLSGNIPVFVDCAHSFGARWKGQLVNKAGDAAIFGSNISKVLSTIFGGIVTTDDEEIYQKLKNYRTRHFKQPSWRKSIRRGKDPVSQYYSEHTINLPNYPSKIM
ncbi:TPA: hypothetical protein EYP66_23220 [Candidatus Poribacteria bacterium]|nr:hypothetical protein [Candidatus Poribacteria bacterium]